MARACALEALILLSAVIVPLALAGEAMNRQRVTFTSGATLTNKFDFDRPHDEIAGDLYKPAGDGPFAAVIIEHDRSEPLPTRKAWAARLVQWGYVVLLVDSLSRPQPRSSDYTYAHDAYGALRYLSTLPIVDPQRVGWIGWAHGGGAAIVRGPGMQSDPKRMRMPPAWLGGQATLRFRAAIAFYPPCPGVPRAYYGPMLLLLGGQDQADHLQSCLATAEQSTAGGRSLRVKVYPEATHYFDIPGVTRDQEGELAHHDPAATADAIARVKAFLAEHLQP